MNYIELIQKFWKCNNEISIGVNATSLYFYLLEINNSLSWKETFKHSDRYISVQLGISVNTVRTAKNKLKQLGLIDFSSPKKPSKGLEGSTTYSFKKKLTISIADSVHDTDADTVINTVHDTDADTVINTVHDTDADTRIKLNKTKEEKEYKKKTSVFRPPTFKEVKEYCKQRGNQVDVNRFIDFYQSKGWMVGRNKMKDWKACVRTWEKEDKTKPTEYEQPESNLHPALR